MITACSAATEPPAPPRTPPAPRVLNPRLALGWWRTELGSLRIAPRAGDHGKRVAGAWRFQDGPWADIGLLCGELEGNVLRFRWQEPAAKEPSAGEGYLVFERDGAGFTGSAWSASGNRGGQWTGRRDDATGSPEPPALRPAVACDFQGGLCTAYTLLGEYDRAITSCEAQVADRGRIDDPSWTWYDLSRAYLARKRWQPARSAANQFIRLHKTDPGGYVVIGDSYFEERNWADALELYLTAERFAEQAQDTPLGAAIDYRLGRCYRRLNKPKEAIARLEPAIMHDPGKLQYIIELGYAYLADRQDDRAFAMAMAAISGPGFDRLPAIDQARLHSIAGHAAYDVAVAVASRAPDRPARPEYLAGARAQLEIAHRLRPEEIEIRLALVQVIDYQAYRALTADPPDAGRAEKLLQEARAVDPTFALTNYDLAILALSRRDCDAARSYLEAIELSPSYVLMYHRLLGAAYLCAGEADRAGEQYALADRTALEPKFQADQTRAEIDTEWAQLVARSNLGEAIEMLETATQLAGHSDSIRRAAQRNLARARYRRGWSALRAGDAAKAAEDFAAAARNPDLLKGTELALFEYSQALALLRRGARARAARIFDRLAQAGGQSKYLQPAYVGAKLRALPRDLEPSQILIEPASLDALELIDVRIHFQAPPPRLEPNWD